MNQPTTGTPYCSGPRIKEAPIPKPIVIKKDLPEVAAYSLQPQNLWQLIDRNHHGKGGREHNEMGCMWIEGGYLSPLA